MSGSQLLIDGMLAELQLDINALPEGSRFELKDLFTDEDWQNRVVAARLDKSVTVPFKRRIRGWPESIQASLTNVRVEDVRNNGRERMFSRVNGEHIDPGT